MYMASRVHCIRQQTQESMSGIGNDLATYFDVIRITYLSVSWGLVP